MEAGSGSEVPVLDSPPSVGFFFFWGGAVCLPPSFWQQLSQDGLCAMGNLRAGGYKIIWRLGKVENKTKPQLWAELFAPPGQAQVLVVSVEATWLLSALFFWVVFLLFGASPGHR